MPFPPRSPVAPLLALAVLASPAPLAAQAADAVPRSAEDGGPRVFEVTATTLNVREGRSTASPVVTRLKDGEIVSNLGCAQANGRVWCDIQQLGGGPRGYAAAEFLTPAVSPDGSVAMGPDDSALRAGRGDFDARGSARCSLEPTGPMESCELGVARAGGGFATVVITHANDRQRAIYFANGVAVGADSSGEFVASESGDIHYLNIGNERYEIVDAVVVGG